MAPFPFPIPLPLPVFVWRMLWPANLVDATDLDHKFGSGFWEYLRPVRVGPLKFSTKEVTGIVYTRRGGFIDLGHVRDNIDNTYYYYRRLLNQRQRSFPPAGYDEGLVRVLEPIPADLVADVASCMAFDESIFHEMETYWDEQFNSAFSPEDLTSNFLGTLIGANAIRRIDNDDRLFDRRVTEELRTVIDLLWPTSVDDALAAFVRVENDWVDAVPIVSDVFIPPALQSGYLRRRNFDCFPVRPWVLSNPDTQVFPQWPQEIPRLHPVDARRFYESTFVSDEDRVSSRDFDSQIARLKVSAEREYGADYQNPSPGQAID